MNAKILVIRFSSLGDIILSSAPVLNLKIGFPKSEITFLTKARYESIVRRFQGIERVITVQDSPSLIEYLRVLIELEKQEFDIVVDLHDNFRSSLARKLITAGQKVVYPRERQARERIVRFKMFSSRNMHTIDKYNRCVEQLGLNPATKRPVITIDDTENYLSFDNDIPKIVIAPGAAFSNKQWPLERFAETAVAIHELFEAHIVWAVTKADSEKIRIDDKIRSDYLTELVDYPINKLAAVISNTDLTIANDSGISHLSSAVGTPVVTLFGPTHPALGFAPRGLHDKIISVDEYCRPCSLHGNKPCFRKEQYCFTKIEPVDVVREAEQMILQSRSATGALFVDRDGTIIVDKPFDSNPENIEFETGSVEARKLAQSSGLKIVMVSNQSGVARGYFGVESVNRFNKRLYQKLLDQNVKLDSIQFCPHYPSGKVHSYTKTCNCRKPASKMAENAARELNIDLRKSYVVGDKLDDINMGRVIGAKSFLVLTGQGKENLAKIGFQASRIDEFVCDNLFEAVKRVIEQQKVAQIT